MRSYVVTDVVARLERDRDLEGRDRDLDRERLFVSTLLEVLDDLSQLADVLQVRTTLSLLTRPQPEVVCDVVWARGKSEEARR